MLFVAARRSVQDGHSRFTMTATALAAGVCADSVPRAALDGVQRSSGAPMPKAAAFAKPAADNMTLTAVDGIKVGHHTLTERPTGCTVDPRQGRARPAASTCAAARRARARPTCSTRSTSCRWSTRSSLSGGSAFGLDAASGVMRYLEERNIGYPVGAAGVVPIVPAAILFDLGFGGNPKIRPAADCGYKAAEAASDAPVAEGNVGAGAGATVGKMAARSGGGGPMKAGIGSAAITLPNGLVVAAIVAVNAVGDIIDPATGQVVAGVRGADGKLADARKLLRGGGGRAGRAGENTTIGLVATNARLTKVQAQKIAQMAHDGFARAISPAHTPGDGDTIFCARHRHAGTATVNYGQIGALAAEAMADAIVRAATQATASNGLPVGARSGHGSGAVQEVVAVGASSS